MIDPHVRLATHDDAAQLVDLESVARASLESQRGGDRWLATHPARGDGWTAAMSTSTTVVAHIDDVVVGYLVISAVGDVATVEEVFVLPEARELGFGDALLATAIDEAREAGCTFLEGESLPGDRGTKNLYERAGIKARLITVSTPI